MSWKNLLMKQKILVGFGSVLLLLLLISGISINALSKASNGFTNYRELARDANLSGRLQANMLMVRMNVKDFLITSSEKDQQQYAEYYEKMSEFLEEAKKEINAPERAKLINNIADMVDDYDTGFKKVEDYMAERNDLVDNYLNKKGPQMEKTLTQILHSAEADNDMAAAFRSGLAIRNLLIARLYMVKFLDANSMDAVDRVHKEFAEMEKQLVILDAELQNKTRRAHLEETRAAKAVYTEKFDRLVQVITERNDIIDNTLDRIGPLVAKDVEDVKLSVKADQDELGPILQTSNRSANIMTIVVAVIATALAIFLAMFTTNTILNQLGDDPSVIEKVAQEVAVGNLNYDMQINEENNKGVFASVYRMFTALKKKASQLEMIADGDLTAKIEIASEKDVLGNSMKKMSDSLNDVLGQVSSSVSQVSSGADQVSSASQTLSQGASEQASSLEEITSSITEINSQTKQNADNAMQANQLSKSSMQNAEAGNKQMKDLVTAMEDINKSSDEIKKVVKVIDDIAFQINLLALNANVEAARAGKFGKGFAVVAEEVRNLAARSADAVKETTQMVEESVKNIDKGNQLVEATAKQLLEIVDGAAKATDLVEEIATASNEQAQGLEQINKGLGQVDQVTQSNTASAEESASASEELASQAQQLKAMISRFKLAARSSGDQSPTSGLSPEALKQLIKEEMSRKGGMSHSLVLGASENKTRKESKIPVAVASDGNGGNKTLQNPKDIIKLDDEDFGKF